MKSLDRRLLTCLILFAALSPSLDALAAGLTSREAILAAYASLPLTFEPTGRQADGNNEFLSRSSGAVLLLDRQKVLVRLYGEAGRPDLSIRFAGASHRAQMSGLEPLEGRVNYFLGQDPKNWRTNIETFSRVKVAGLYEGIDVVYYGQGQQLEYDFLVAPGADPESISMDFAGADSIALEDCGDLALRIGARTLRQLKPVAYQMIDGVRVEVASHYKLRRRGRVGISVAKYDRSRSLVIDPTLSYSTTLGSSHSATIAANAVPRGVAVDTNGNAYVTGLSGYPDFPNTTGVMQPWYGKAFVTKLNSTGTGIVYSTWLGLKQAKI